MTVFLSWSGEQSRRLAEGLDHLMGELGLQSWVSSTKLQPGDHWSKEILEALERCETCIACVTAASRQSGWMHFEAGATKRRIAVLYDLSQTRTQSSLLTYL